MSQEELEAQFKRQEFIYLQKSSIEFALKQGIEQGRKKGIEEGIEEGKKQVAKALLDMGIDLEQISLATGLTIEEIKKYKGCSQTTPTSAKILL